MRMSDSKFEIVEVVQTVSKDAELAALREALVAQTRRAQVAEKQLNDIVMGASMKLATARMVLSRVQEKLTGSEQAAVMGVLDCIPQDVLKKHNGKTLLKNN
jgi:hypothetical protein